MLLPISLTIAGAAALVHIWLSVRVSQVRRPTRISVGDGGHDLLARRMRAHGNFSENMPLFLVLLLLVELASGGNLLLWGLGIAFMLARFAHAFGMERPSANPLRVGGIAISWAVLATLAIWAIALAYRSPALGSGIQISPGRSAEMTLD